MIRGNCPSTRQYTEDGLVASIAPSLVGGEHTDIQPRHPRVVHTGQMDCTSEQTRIDVGAGGENDGGGHGLTSAQGTDGHIQRKVCCHTPHNRTGCVTRVCALDAATAEADAGSSARDCTSVAAAVGAAPATAAVATANATAAAATAAALLPR